MALCIYRAAGSTERRQKTEVDLPPVPSLNLERLRQLATLQEYCFRSSIPLIGPLIARLRAAWNSVSTKWYVRPLLQQQNEFNELVAVAIAAHDADLHNQAAQLRVFEDRLAEDAIRPGELQARIRDHDAWLIAQDREQSELVRDLAELRLLLVQMNRLLLALNGQAHRLDVTKLPEEKERGA
jgi:hypothetical protein